MKSEPEICHQASGVVGVWKPGGWPTQAPPGIASVETWLRDRLGPGAYLGVPHRLDRAVSGVLLFAATPRAARQLSRQFERRLVRKTYLALAAVAAADALATLDYAGVEGEVWEDIIEKVPDEPRARIAAAEGAGRRATTRARLIARIGAAEVLVRLEPETGRMHQLRLQAASRGLPIVGDVAYGGPAAPWAPPHDPRAAAIALHAWRLTFADPDTKQPIALEAPLPGAWPAAGVAAVTAAEA